MILIPLNYLKKHLFLPSLALSEIAKKLTYFGLETQLVKKKDQLYLEINSLPNRADLLCWKGIVQEIKILLNCAEKKIKLATLKQSEKELFSVTINTPYCLLFDLFLVKNIQIKESPVWLKEWLVVNQISPVNNLVDSANLAKLETGQSWRLYDYDALAKKRKIVVEPAGKKETIRLVSEKELILTSKDLVVRAEEEIISLAGITETEKFGWTNQTKNVLIERAYFNPLQLKKTARRLNIPILSASFFSLSETLPRLIYFLGETQKNGLDSEIIFTYQKHSFKPRLIRVSQLFLEKKIGQPFPSLQIEKILKQLNFPYSKKGKIYQIKILSHRSDLRIPEDLLEELLRIYDYNQIVGSVS